MIITGSFQYYIILYPMEILIVLDLLFQYVEFDNSNKNIKNKKQNVLYVV